MGLTANTGPYNAAAEHYGVDDPIMSKIPRKKFQFSIEITVNESVNLFDESYGRSFTFHRVQGINLPDYSFNTTTVNQYNRLRHVHTRIEPTQAGITFYDTVDNQFQSLLRAYTQHYSHGLNLDSATINAYDTTNPVFNGSFGLKAIAPSQRYFFPKIAIYSQDTATSGRTITMFNCMITSVQHDRLDYSDSAPVLWQVQFQPEHVNIDDGNSVNGSSSSGAQAPTQAYDVAKSAAAGVLVNAAGNVIKDAVGNAISTSSIVNFGTTSSSNQVQFAIDSAGNALKDALGNPIVIGETIASAAGASRAVGTVAGAVANVALNRSSTASAVSTVFKRTGVASGFRKVFNLF